MVGLTVATWNVLADSYLNVDQYPRADRELLSPHARDPATTRMVSGLIHDVGADVVCLQEVEPSVLSGVRHQMPDFQVFWTPRSQTATDGCLTITTGRWRLVEGEARSYSTEPQHISQRLALVAERASAVVYNTHLCWAADDGFTVAAQAAELAGWVDAETVPTVVAGDLNAPPSSDALDHLRAVGCTDPHRDAQQRTAYFEGVGSVRVDYLLVRGAVGLPVHHPCLVVLQLDALPTRMLPSDHIPLAARVEF